VPVLVRKIGRAFHIQVIEDIREWYLLFGPDRIIIESAQRHLSAGRQFERAAGLDVLVALSFADVLVAYAVADVQDDHAFAAGFGDGIAIGLDDCRLVAVLGQQKREVGEFARGIPFLGGLGLGVARLDVIVGPAIRDAVFVRDNCVHQL